MVGRGNCALCDVSASLSCGGCGIVHYCNKDHQKKHWPNHRDKCRPYKTISTPVGGKFLVAARNLGAGEVLLRDSPLVVGPLAYSPLVCLGCHSNITTPEFPRCPGCWWPLCSPDCATARLHQSECAILSTDSKRIAAPKDHGETPRYGVIFFIRCILLQSENPAGWKILMDMASHSEARQQNREEIHEATTKYVTEVLKLNIKLDVLHHVYGAIATNSLGIRSPKSAQIRALYPKVRLFNHACVPNTSLTATPNGTMEARTSVPIEADEPLLICYCGTTLPLWERKATLSDTYYFNCECPRCDDPTELGTHFSSPRCPDCKNQFLQPSGWLGETVWTCKVCKQEKSDSQVQSSIQEWTERLKMDDIFGYSENSVKRVKGVLDQVLDAFHPNHYVWMRVAQLALCKLMKDHSEKSLQLRKDIWDRLLTLYDKFEPGLNRRRGMSLVESGVLQLTLLKKEYENGDHFMPMFLKEVRRTLERLEEADRILSLEPAGSEAESTVRMAKIKRAEAEDFLEQLNQGTVRGE